MSKKIGFWVVCAVSLWLLVPYAQGSASAYSVYFCLEANCPAVTVTFGGVTHSYTLDCDSILAYSGVPAGTYAYSASGCGLVWSGSITVTSDVFLVACPPAGYPEGCCPVGCGEYGAFVCSTCLACTPPAAVTEAATGVSATAATLQGSVNPEGCSTDYRFVYGPTPSFGSATSWKSAGSVSIPVSVSEPVSGLTCATTYYYRVEAANSGGSTSGNTLNFVTSSCPCSPPAAVTNAATEVSDTAATLQGEVNPHGCNTLYRFEYGETVGYGNQTSWSSAGSGVTAVPVSQGISGLNPDTTYHYRIVAENSGGPAHGDDSQFTTNAGSQPDWGDAYDMLFDDPQDLTFLRIYRDQVLSQSQKGALYTWFLYESSEEALQLLLDNPDLMEELQYLLDVHRDAMIAVLNGEEGVIYDSAQISFFLDNLIERSSGDPRLLAFLVKQQLQTSQKKGELFFGFTLR